MQFVSLIGQHLKPGQLVPNWSYAGQIRVAAYQFVGAEGNLCYLKDVKGDAVHVISEYDMQYLASHWKQYTSGQIKRPELRNGNRNTTYTICLMHYLETVGLL